MKKYTYKDNIVTEVPTGIRYVRANKEDAKKLCGRLNGGAGFQGETPAFFAYSKEKHA